MLLFIRCKGRAVTSRVIFQNISCYCLSWNPISKKSYRWISKHLMLLFIKFAIWKQCGYEIFQNISCYCLSLCSYPQTLLLQSFQNISCYCLSFWSAWSTWCSLISKHLMLLFIRRSPTQRIRSRTISKHLMLLFIPLDCHISIIKIPISKHLMLLFIRNVWIACYS